MADDTRQPNDATAQSTPPKPPANIMPGGTAHTAGGQKADAAGPGYWEVVRNLGPEYYLNFHKRPCIRDSQLQAISAGFAGGGFAAIIGSMWFLNPMRMQTFKWSKQFISKANHVHRASTHCDQLGCSNLVWCYSCLISSLPILSKQREGWHQNGTGADGQETSQRRSEERSAEESERRIRAPGRNTTGSRRRGEKAVMEILVREESQILVTDGRPSRVSGQASALPV